MGLTRTHKPAIMFESCGCLRVQELQRQHETFKNTTLKEGDGHYEALNGLAEQLATAGSAENSYTAHTPQVGGQWVCKHWIDSHACTYTLGASERHAFTMHCCYASPLLLCSTAVCV